MWNNYIFKVVGILIAFSLLFFSCRNDSDDKNEEVWHDYDFIIKPVETDYLNINRVMLYVFDSDKKLADSQEAQLDQGLKLSYPAGLKFTVVAWGYTAGQKLPGVINGMEMDDILLTLDTTVFAGQTIAYSPEDLFYGVLNIDNPYVDLCSEVREYTLWIRRKVASVSIIAHNLQGALQTADTNFSYVLGEIPRYISFSNLFGGDKVGHHPPVKFDVERDYLTASDFYTFPMRASDRFRLDIYRGDQLLKSFLEDNYGTDFRLQEGRRHLIWIEYSNDSSSPDINVTLKVNDWNDRDMSEEFK